MRRFLSESKFIHYVMGVIMIFGLIMLEGGWSFDPEDDNRASTNWSTGNVIDTSIIAVLMFAVFYVSSKSRLIPNIIFYILVLAIYGLNTQMNYWSDRDMISEKVQSRIYLVSKILFIICMLILLYGFIDYIMFQRAEYGNKFSWYLFFVGTRKCSSIKDE